MPVSHFYRSHSVVMAKNLAVVIREDPRITHRPVEALRIALGLVAGTHSVTVVLLGEAWRLISEDTDDIVDVDILEKYLPSLQHLEVPFLLQTGNRETEILDGFLVTYESADSIQTFVTTVDSVLVF